MIMKNFIYHIIILLSIYPFTVLGQVKIKQEPVMVKIMNGTGNHNKQLDLGGLSGIE
mgnify:FL=1